MKKTVFAAAALGALMLAGPVFAQYDYGFDPHGGSLYGHIDHISHSIRAHADRGDIRPDVADKDLAELHDIKAEARDIVDHTGYMTPGQWHTLNHRANVIGERARLSEAEAGGWGE